MVWFSISHEQVVGFDWSPKFSLFQFAQLCGQPIWWPGGLYERSTWTNQEDKWSSNACAKTLIHLMRFLPEIGLLNSHNQTEINHYVEDLWIQWRKKILVSLSLVLSHPWDRIKIPLILPSIHDAERGRCLPFWRVNSEIWNLCAMGFFVKMRMNHQVTFTCDKISSRLRWLSQWRILDFGLVYHDQIIRKQLWLSMFELEFRSTWGL